MLGALFERQVHENEPFRENRGVPVPKRNRLSPSIREDILPQVEGTSPGWIFEPNVIRHAQNNEVLMPRMSQGQNSIVTPI
jgi:hypothetical protein